MEVINTGKLFVKTPDGFRCLGKIEDIKITMAKPKKFVVYTSCAGSGLKGPFYSTHFDGVWLSVGGDDATEFDTYEEALKAIDSSLEYSRLQYEMGGATVQWKREEYKVVEVGETYEQSLTKHEVVEYHPTTSRDAVKTPESITPHDQKFIKGSWRNYTLNELGDWVHLLAKRSQHRSSLTKKLKDLEDAQNYLNMMQEHVLFLKLLSEGS